MKDISFIAIAFLMFLIVNSCSAFKSHQIGNTNTMPLAYIPKDTLQTAPLNVDENQKQLNFVCSKNLTLVGGETIYVSFYDPVNRKKNDTTVITDTSGRASILIPAAEEGASSVFRFSIDSAMVSTLTAVRIPPKDLYGGQMSITIKFDVDMLKMHVEGAPLQYIHFPSDGAAIPNGGDIFLNSGSIISEKSK